MLFNIAWLIQSKSLIALRQGFINYWPRQDYFVILCTPNSESKGQAYSDWFFSFIASLERKLSARSETKKGQLDELTFAFLVTPTGFKPVTLRAEIWYSIQLNYGAILRCKYNFQGYCAIPFVREMTQVVTGTILDFFHALCALTVSNGSIKKALSVFDKAQSSSDPKR